MAWCECLTPNLVFEKLFSKRKKSSKLKLRENIHEVTVNNLCKSQVALQVTAREVTIFFLEISTISGYITRFAEIVARRSGDLQITPWLVRAKFDQLHGFLCRQTKSLGTTDMQSCLLKFFSTEPGPYKIQVCKCSPHH